jgi:hypothetical protein
MIVYHGSYTIIEQPLVKYSKPKLDFGKGFYVTTVLSQAKRWAKRKAALENVSSGYVNVYDLADYSGYRVKEFGDNRSEWLNFVCDCRRGANIYQDYDIIKGDVADDTVYNVVNMYKNGAWDEATALAELKVYKLYDQICITSQPVADALLKFQAVIEVSL